MNSRLAYLDYRQRTQGQRTTNRTAQATAQVDYVPQLGEKSRFETGARSTRRRYDTDYQFRSVPAFAFNPSNRFVYSQYAQAAYGLYSGPAASSATRPGCAPSIPPSWATSAPPMSSSGSAT